MNRTEKRKHNNLNKMKQGTDPEGNAADGEHSEVSEVGKSLNPVFDRFAILAP